MLRRLSVDPVLAVVTYRGPGDRLNEAAQRMLSSVENRLLITLEGLGPDEVAALAAALRPEPLEDEVVRRLYQDTGGHPLYLRTLLSEGSGFDPRAPGRSALPRSLAAAVGDHLRGLPSRDPGHPGDARGAQPAHAAGPAGPGGTGRLAQRGDRARGRGRPGGLVARGARPARWPSATRWCGTPSTPVSPPPGGASCTPAPPLFVSEAASWEHRVAALDQPDEDLAAQLEQLAGEEAARRPSGAGRHPPAVGLRTSPRSGRTGNGGC